MSVLILFLVLYLASVTRAFQLQILASVNIEKLYNQQHSKALEARQLVKDLQHSLDKLSGEQRIQITDAIILGVEKAKLQKEINALKPKYDKLSNDVQLLQKTLRDLTILQEKEVGQIIKIFEQSSIKERWPSFFMSFIAGILTSLIASLIYNFVVIRSKMFSMGYLIKIIQDRLIHLKKE